MTVVAHERRFARAAGGRVVYRHAGRIVDEGPVPELIESPQWSGFRRY